MASPTSRKQPNSECVVSDLLHPAYLNNSPRWKFKEPPPPWQEDLRRSEFLLRVFFFAPPPPLPKPEVLTSGKPPDDQDWVLPVRFPVSHTLFHYVRPPLLLDRQRSISHPRFVPGSWRALLSLFRFSPTVAVIPIF